MTQLAIAIVHYHAEPLLAQCLKRLQASSFADLAVCVVDCGSGSGLEWVPLLDARFRVLSPGRNLGFAAGTNLAFHHLPPDTPYLLMLNPDVLVEPDTIERLVGILDEEPSLGAAVCKLLLPSGAIDPACRRSDPRLFSAFSKQTGLQRLFPRSRLFGRYNLTYLDANAPHEVNSGTGACLLIRRQAWLAAGGQLDERFFLYGEDLDLCRRIRQAGYRLLYRPDVTATHIKGSGRIRDSRTTVYFYRAMWTYYRKWGKYRSNPIVLVPLIGTIALLALIELTGNSGRRAIHSPQGRDNP